MPGESCQVAKFTKQAWALASAVGMALQEAEAEVAWPGA